MAHLACKKDQINWEKEHPYNRIYQARDFTGLNTIDSFWFDASYSGIKGSFHDTVVWVSEDSFSVNNTLYHPLHAPIPFVKESVIGNVLYLILSEPDSRFLRFQSMGSAKLLFFSLVTDLSADTATFYTSAKKNSVSIIANRLTPSRSLHYQNKDYTTLNSSIDSINTKSFDTYRRTFTWADSLGIVETHYYRIAPLNGDTIEQVNMRRIFR